MNKGSDKKDTNKKWEYDVQLINQNVFKCIKKLIVKLQFLFVYPPLNFLLFLYRIKLRSASVYQLCNEPRERQGKSWWGWKKKERDLQSLAISTPTLLSPSHAPLFSRFRAKFAAVLHITSSLLCLYLPITAICVYVRVHVYTYSRTHLHAARSGFILNKRINGSGECKYKLSASHHSWYGITYIK